MRNLVGFSWVWIQCCYFFYYYYYCTRVSGLECEVCLAGTFKHTLAEFTTLGLVLTISRKGLWSALPTNFLSVFNRPTLSTDFCVSWSTLPIYFCVSDQPYPPTFVGLIALTQWLLAVWSTLPTDFCLYDRPYPPTFVCKIDLTHRLLSHS